MTRDVDWYAEHEKLEMEIGRLQYLRNVVEHDLQREHPNVLPAQMKDMQGRFILLDIQVAITQAMTTLANLLLRETL